MNPFVELAIQGVEKVVELVVRLINDNSAHTAEEKAAMQAALHTRMDLAAGRVAAVKFKDV